MPGSSPGMTRRLRTGTSQQHGQRVIDQLLESGEELRADRAVDDAMIAGERAGHHRGDRELAVLHHRPLLAGPDREDAALRRVDYRGEFADAVHPEVGDREG